MHLLSRKYTLSKSEAPISLLHTYDCCIDGRVSPRHTSVIDLTTLVVGHDEDKINKIRNGGIIIASTVNTPGRPSEVNGHLHKVQIQRQDNEPKYGLTYTVNFI